MKLIVIGVFLVLIAIASYVWGNDYHDRDSFLLKTYDRCFRTSGRQLYTPVGDIDDACYEKAYYKSYGK